MYKVGAGVYVYIFYVQVYMYKKVGAYVIVR